jgi:hypothetical protein
MRQATLPFVEAVRPLHTDWHMLMFQIRVIELIQLGDRREREGRELCLQTTILDSPLCAVIRKDNKNRIWTRGNTCTPMIQYQPVSILSSNYKMIQSGIWLTWRGLVRMKSTISCRTTFDDFLSCVAIEENMQLPSLGTSVTWNWDKSVTNQHVELVNFIKQTLDHITARQQRHSRIIIYH